MFDGEFGYADPSVACIKTIGSGAPNVCPDCKVHLVRQVLRSNAGYYIGTQCDCGPYSRESGYYAHSYLAEQALATESFGR